MIFLAIFSLRFLLKLTYLNTFIEDYDISCFSLAIADYADIAISPMSY